MGFFRFRRSFKIDPGIRWNFGKKSSSVSFGGRGFHYTVGSRGSRTTVGIPGTGMSYTETSGRPSSSSGCAGCLGQIILFFLVLGGISMCVRNDKEGSSARSSPSATTQASATPSVQFTPVPSATPTPFPESCYWPKEVCLLKSVEFSGTVSGGTVRSTVSAGTILPAHLSKDHQNVEVRMNDLTSTISLDSTDFLKRAELKKSRSHD